MNHDGRTFLDPDDSFERLQQDVANLLTTIPDSEAALESYDVSAMQQLVLAQRGLLEQFLHAAEALQQREDRYRLLVSAIEDYAIFMLDPHGYVLSWNQGAQRIKGYHSEEIIGHHFSRFYPPEDIKAGKPLTILTIASEWGHYSEEGWRIRKDGSRFWASVMLTAIYDHHGTLRGFGKVTRDLTERKISEEVLRQSEERFRLLVEGVRDYAIFMLDPRGHIASWNTGAEIITGYSATSIIGSHFSIFYPKADVEAGKPAWELEVAERDGQYEEEGWRVRSDGSLFWSNVLITAIRDANGQLRGFGKVTRDLTEQRRASEEREALRQSEVDLAREREARQQIHEAMKTRDQFFAIASHELKTPLTTFVMSVQLLKRRLARYPDLTTADQERVQGLLNQALRLNRLVNSLLDMSRIQDQRFNLVVGNVDLVALVQRLLEEIRPTLRQHHLDVTLPSHPVILQGDQDRLEQVLQNLLHNALKYSPNGGCIAIAVEEADDHVCMTVQDPGIGIPAEDLNQIFVQFYRGSNVEHHQFSGMGIGLYVSQAIIAMHHGTIEVISEVGVGTCFRVCLPLEAPPAAAKEPENEDH